MPMVELDFSILSHLRPYKPSPVGRQLSNLIGKKFGRITPLGLLGLEVGGAKWLCRCDCGKFSIVKATKLLLGLTVSCGCYHREQTGNRARTHGQSGSYLHRLWGDILTRTTNPNYKQAKDYSGRGITICDRWRKFENFRDDILSSIGERPTRQHTIDRINNARGYEPSNIRWATRAEQNRNTRKNVYLEINGESRCVSDWARISGLTQSIVWKRLKRGWTPEEALGIKERG